MSANIPKPTPPPNIVTREFDAGGFLLAALIGIACGCGVVQCHEQPKPATACACTHTYGQEVSR